MSNGGGLDHKEVIEQVVQKKQKKIEDVEFVIKDLDEKKREDIKNSTKSSFEDTIRSIRTSGDYSKIATPENALVLKTYAVLFLGVKSSDIGGINNQFDEKALAILRKCQADGIGGKQVNGVSQSELSKVTWGTTAESGTGDRTRSLSKGAESIDDAGFTQLKEKVIGLLKNIDIGGSQLPRYIQDKITNPELKPIETEKKGVYKIQDILNTQLGFSITEDIYINTNGELVDSNGEKKEYVELTLKLGETLRKIKETTDPGKKKELIEFIVFGQKGESSVSSESKEEITKFIQTLSEIKEGEITLGIRNGGFVMASKKVLTRVE